VAVITHWEPNGGYIKRYGPVCGIHEKTTMWSAVCSEDLKDRVDCDFCLVWIRERDRTATLRDIDERVVNMTFNNNRLSAHDAETAIQRGIREGLAKVADDFRATKPELEQMVADGVQKALQRHGVKENLIGIHKIAEDQLDAEFDDDAHDEEQLALMKQAVREVLAEAAPGQSGAGVGTKVEFTQNVYSPEPLSATEIYRQGRSLAEALATSRHHLAEPGVGTQAVTVNVAAEVDPSAFKDMVKQAINEGEDENDAEYVAWFREQINAVLDDREQKALEWNAAWNAEIINRFLTPTPVEKPAVMHYRPLYRDGARCGSDTTNSDVTRDKSKVDCEACLEILNI
jgi:hypothetical protein